MADEKTTAAKDTEVVADRIRKLNEQVLDLGRDGGLQFLEAYEVTVKSFTEFQDKVADSTQIEWVAAAARARAQFTREITNAYAKGTRDLLEK